MHLRAPQGSRQMTLFQPLGTLVAVKGLHLIRTYIPTNRTCQDVQRNDSITVSQNFVNLYTTMVEVNCTYIVAGTMHGGLARDSYTFS